MRLEKVIFIRKTSLEIIKEYLKLSFPYCIIPLIF